MKDSDEMKFSWRDLVKAVVYLFGTKRTNYLFWLSVLFLIQFYGIIPPLVVGKIVDFFTNKKIFERDESGAFVRDIDNSLVRKKEYIVE